MRYLWAVLALVVFGPPVSGGDLPPAVREAVLLELGGRLTEALDRYRSALTNDPALAGDESLEKTATVLALSKAAHLSVDLGLGEEAWDLSGRLVRSPNPQAVEAGTLVRMRLYRLAGKPVRAKGLYDQLVRSGPPSDPGFPTELRLLSVPVRAQPGGGVTAWNILPSPVEVLGLAFRESSRIQVGAFQDGGNAETLAGMLREKGWQPYSEVRTISQGSKLHIVYVISRNPDQDRGRLTSQGFPTLP